MAGREADELMNRMVFTCKPSDSLKHAAQLMWTHDIGCLAVTDDEGKAIGMVTDRDLLMGTHLSGRALHEEPVSSAMSKQLAVILASICQPRPSSATARG